MTAGQLLHALALELSPGVLAFVDVDSLLSLEIVSSSVRGLIGDELEARCKRACFSTYLYPTMATYTTIAATPPSWKLLYLRFRWLRAMQWTPCKSEGASSTLRSLKTDNQEYIADLECQFLLKSGGHYWFSVLQTPLADVELSNPLGSTEDVKQHIDLLGGTEKQKALAFIRAPFSINVGKWEKLFLQPAATGNEGSVVVPVRRVLFFGGQAEGIPFEAFNDLNLLLIDGRRNQSSVNSSGKTLARWIRPSTSGQPPSRRCGHDATLLSNELLLISGGSDGTTPYRSLEVFLLHIESDSAYGQFRWSTPRSESLPPGRGMHSVYRIADNEVLVFGGRQISYSNGLLDVHRLTIQLPEDAGDDSAPRGIWTKPELSGAVPAPRRGHSTIAIGDKLVLIGGQDEETEQLHCDVRVLDVPLLEWRLPVITSETPPCPRRGFKTQYFGTSLVISSGFVRRDGSKKIDQQLPDGDIHALTFR